MKALSIKQPYAGLVIAGIKTVENRSWAPKLAQGTIAIVSTASPDAAKWWGPERESCKKLKVAFPEELCKINGSILGTVTFDHIIWMSEKGKPETDAAAWPPNWKTWWIPDSIGFIFEHPKKLLRPIPLKGRLGLYALDENVVEEIESQGQ